MSTNEQNQSAHPPRRAGQRWRMERLIAPTMTLEGTIAYQQGPEGNEHWVLSGVKRTDTNVPNPSGAFYFMRWGDRDYTMTLIADVPEQEAPVREEAIFHAESNATASSTQPAREEALAGKPARPRVADEALGCKAPRWCGTDVRKEIGPLRQEISQYRGEAVSKGFIVFCSPSCCDAQPKVAAEACGDSACRYFGQLHDFAHVAVPVCKRWCAPGSCGCGSSAKSPPVETCGCRPIPGLGKQLCSMHSLAATGLCHNVIGKPGAHTECYKRGGCSYESTGPVNDLPAIQRKSPPVETEKVCCSCGGPCNLVERWLNISHVVSRQWCCLTCYMAGERNIARMTPSTPSNAPPKPAPLPIVDYVWDCLPWGDR